MYHRTWPSTTRNLAKISINIYLQKYLYMNVDSSFTCHRLISETTQVPINWWLDKQTVVYPCKEILPETKKNRLEAHNNVDESQKHIEQKNADIEEYVLYDPVFILNSRKDDFNLWPQKADQITKQNSFHLLFPTSARMRGLQWRGQVLFSFIPLFSSSFGIGVL